MLLHQKVTNFNADLTHERLKITTQHRKRLRVYTLPFIVKVLTFAP